MDKATFLRNMDKYIDGALSKDEKKEYDAFLNEYPSMQTELDIHIKSRNAIVKQGRQDLYAHLNEIREDVKADDNQKNKRKSILYKLVPYSIAASLLLIAGFFWLNQSQISEGEILYSGVKEIQILPDEGKFGASQASSRQIIIRKSKISFYEDKGDLLILYVPKKLNYNEIKLIQKGDKIQISENSQSLELNKKVE